MTIKKKTAYSLYAELVAAHNYTLFGGGHENRDLMKARRYITTALDIIKKESGLEWKLQNGNRCECGFLIEKDTAPHHCPKCGKVFEGF